MGCNYNVIGKFNNEKAGDNKLKFYFKSQYSQNPQGPTTECLP